MENLSNTPKNIWSICPMESSFVCLFIAESETFPMESPEDALWDICSSLSLPALLPRWFISSCSSYGNSACQAYPLPWLNFSPYPSNSALLCPFRTYRGWWPLALDGQGERGSLGEAIANYHCCPWDFHQPTLVPLTLTLTINKTFIKPSSVTPLSVIPIFLPRPWLIPPTQGIYVAAAFLWFMRHT